MKEKKATVRILLVLGGIGLVIHGLSARWLMFRGIVVTPGWFLNGLVVNGGLIFFGGVLYALILRYPVAEAVRERKVSRFVLFKGGVGGAIASIAALQARYLTLACLLTHKMMVGVPEGSARTALFLAIMEVETYGLIEIIYLSIPAFLCGALTTAGVAYAMRVGDGRSAKP